MGPRIRTGGRLAGAFAVAYLLVQVGVPTLKLFDERPVQFGWQMFSANRSVPPVAAIYEDSTVRLDARALLIHSRRDVDFRPHLIQHVCETTGARAVEIGFVTRGDTASVVPCR